MRELFLLDPDVVFLNHGSFGACPRPVFERYQAWQRELEREPVDFIVRRLPGLLAEARAALAAYVGAAADDLTFVQNAGTGVNMAARSLDLQPGDEVLATDLEYGACDLAWEAICARAGARYVRAEMPLPVGDVVEALFAQRTERTRVVYASHITSATGVLLPVEEIVAPRARRAHHDRRRRARARATCRSTSRRSAPTSTPATATSGSARRRARASCTCGPSTRSASTDRSSAGATRSRRRSSRAREEQGTRDAAAYLTVPDAIAFQRGARVGRRARTLRRTRPRGAPRALRAARHRADRAGGDGAPDGERAPARRRRRRALGRTLWEEHRIEIPVMRPQKDLLRISIAAYTTREDVERLLDALPRALATSRSPTAP